jgi:hypothetical protein
MVEGRVEERAGRRSSSKKGKRPRFIFFLSLEMTAVKAFLFWLAEQKKKIIIKIIKNKNLDLSPFLFPQQFRFLSSFQSLCSLYLVQNQLISFSSSHQD